MSENLLQQQQKEKRSATVIDKKATYKPLPMVPPKRKISTPTGSYSPITNPTIKSEQSSPIPLSKETEGVLSQSSNSVSFENIKEKNPSNSGTPETKLEEKNSEKKEVVIDTTSIIEDHFFGENQDFMDLTKEKPKPVTRKRNNNVIITKETKQEINTPPSSFIENTLKETEKKEDTPKVVEDDNTETKINDFEEIPLKKESAIAKIGKKKKKENNPLLENYIKKLVEIPKKPTNDVQIVDLLQDLIPSSKYDTPIVIYKLISIEDILKGISHTEVKEKIFKIKK